MQDDPHHMVSRRLVETVAKGLVSACVFPQILLEFYSVVTNPRRVFSPLSVTDALREVSNLRNIFHLVNPQESPWIDSLNLWPSPAQPNQMSLTHLLSLKCVMPALRSSAHTTNRTSLVFLCKSSRQMNYLAIWGSRRIGLLLSMTNRRAAKKLNLHYHPAQIPSTLCFDDRL